MEEVRASDASRAHEHSLHRCQGQSDDFDEWTTFQILAADVRRGLRAPGRHILLLLGNCVAHPLDVEPNGSRLGEVDHNKGLVLPSCDVILQKIEPERRFVASPHATERLSYCEENLKAFV